MRSFLLAGGLLLAAASMIFAAPVGSLEPRSPPHGTQHPPATKPAHAHVAEMQQMAHHNNAMTMASMKINMHQQTTSALASVGNNGAKNIADAAKGY